jgi:hypothetical protein
MRRVRRLCGGWAVDVDETTKCAVRRRAGIGHLKDGLRNPSLSIGQILADPWIKGPYMRNMPKPLRPWFGSWAHLRERAVLAVMLLVVSIPFRAHAQPADPFQSVAPNKVPVPPHNTVRPTPSASGKAPGDADSQNGGQINKGSASGKLPDEANSQNGDQLRKMVQINALFLAGLGYPWKENMGADKDAIITQRTLDAYSQANGLQHLDVFSLMTYNLLKDRYSLFVSKWLSAIQQGNQYPNYAGYYSIDCRGRHTTGFAFLNLWMIGSWSLYFRDNKMYASGPISSISGEPSFLESSITRIEDGVRRNIEAGGAGVFLGPSGVFLGTQFYLHESAGDFKAFFSPQVFYLEPGTGQPTRYERCSNVPSVAWWLDELL